MQSQPSYTNRFSRKQKDWFVVFEYGTNFLISFKNENRFINVIFIIFIDRRRTYGSSKDSLSCYGSRKQVSSVSSSNVGGEKRKVLRSKTPYSSLPPPPVKKKNLTKVVKIKHIRVEVIVIFCPTKHLLIYLIICIFSHSLTTDVILNDWSLSLVEVQVLDVAVLKDPQPTR